MESPAPTRDSGLGGYVKVAVISFVLFVLCTGGFVLSASAAFVPIFQDLANNADAQTLGRHIGAYLMNPLVFVLGISASACFLVFLVTLLCLLFSWFTRAPAK